MRWVAWKAATRVDWGMAERWKAGRSCWASGRFMVEVAVDSMRCEAVGWAQACLKRVGRIMEAIAVVGEAQAWAEAVGGCKTICRNGEQMLTTMPRMSTADVPVALIGQRWNPGSPVTADFERQSTST